MECRVCGLTQLASAAFCGGCGSSLLPACPSCSHRNPAGHRFCAACGASLEGADREGERRQLTVMFCDLVDYTALAQRLDPEDLREVVEAYHEACADAIAQYDGRIAQYLGDGVLAYFGLPAAHEDDAGRAVIAALAIQRAIPAVQERLSRTLPELRAGTLDARIAVHTGDVVVDDGGGAGHRGLAAIGTTPNIAARLQALAERGSVIVSDATRLLLGDAFVLEDLGRVTLKGVPEPVHAHRVLRERERGAERDRTTKPLVGREPELERLVECWARVCAGHGQVVSIEGEPGIGKSHLVRALRARLGVEASTWIECHGSPYREHTPLHPVIELLERQIGARDGEAVATRAESLARLAADADLADSLPLFRELLSLPEPEVVSTSAALSAEARRRRTQDALVEWLLRFSRRGPAVVVAEDLHWFDPSTRELLGGVVERCGDASLLVLVTQRPGGPPAWPERPWIHSVTLGPLSPEETLRMTRAVSGAHALPEALLLEVSRKTDGVPLFVEEVTKSVIETLRALEGDPETVRAPARLSVPATLRDSLMARLDRLGAAKPVAQLASVIGREFSRELLALLMPGRDAELDAAFARLIESELVRAGPRGTFSFSHALVQETAYESLLRSRRRGIHAQVARVLEERFPERIQSEPEVVARHCAEAGLVERAIAYYRRAGEQAIRRSAHAEATQHLTRGIALVSGIDDGARSAAAELPLQIALGATLVASRGYGNPEVERSHRRARALCADTTEGPQLYQALSGLFLMHQARAELGLAAELAADLLHLGEREHNSFVIEWGCFFSSVPCYYRGEYRACLRHLEQGLALYDPNAQVAQEYVHEHDVGLSLLCYSAMASWSLGAADQSRARIERARTLAHASGLPFNVAFATSFATLVHQLRGDPSSALAAAVEAVKICTEQAFPVYLGLALMLEGWATARLGDAPRGLDTLRRGLAQAAATGTRIEAPRALGLVAEVQLLAGQSKEALASLGTALAIAEQKGSHFWDAELFRLRGEALLQHDADAWDDAAQSFRRAREVARAQEALSLELRAALAEAEGLCRRGEVRAARGLVAPLYASFTEGLELPDLQAARALFDRSA